MLQACTQDEIFLREAIQLAREGMTTDQGGPFGAVIVRDGEIVGKGFNMVTSTNAPTAHAEVVAIRDACQRLGTFHLEDCEVYTTCEPCPMCLGALYWARPGKIYYANNRQDAARIGFDDSEIYKEITVPIPNRRIPMQVVGREEALKVFEEWQAHGNKNLY